MTARELAARLEVSERTVHRDMEALSAAGVPVFAERGTGGGWRLPEGYRTTLTGMSAHELQSLLLATPSLLRDLGLGASFDGAWQKLLASSPAGLKDDLYRVRQRIHIDGAGWHQSAETSPLLPTVQDAVWQERRLLIRYQRDDQVVERNLAPLGLVAKRGVWYLVAQVDGEFRTYRISRLLEAHLLDEGFTRPAGFDLEAHWERSTQEFKARLPRSPAHLRIAERPLPRVAQERYVKLLRTEPAGPGWVEAEVEFHTLESACQLILGFGPEVEAVAPAELRAAVVTHLQATLARYQEASSS